MRDPSTTHGRAITSFYVARRQCVNYHNLIIHRLWTDGLTKPVINDLKGSWNSLDNMEDKPRDDRQFDYLQVFLLRRVASRLALSTTNRERPFVRKAAGECGSRDMVITVRY
jgi:hypothetical protein